MIEGIIDVKTKSVDSIMVKGNLMNSLDMQTEISNQTAKKLTRLGFSRIPVYSHNKNHVVGIMLIKSLIGVDLNEAHSIGDLIEMEEIELRKPLFISPDKTIESLLIDFRQGRSHMALVV